MPLGDPGYDALYQALGMLDKGMQRKLILVKRGQAEVEERRCKPYWGHFSRQPMSGEGTPE